MATPYKSRLAMTRRKNGKSSEFAPKSFGFRPRIPRDLARITRRQSRFRPLNREFRFVTQLRLM